MPHHIVDPPTAETTGADTVLCTAVGAEGGNGAAAASPPTPRTAATDGKNEDMVYSENVRKQVLPRLITTCTILARTFCVHILCGFFRLRNQQTNPPMSDEDDPITMEPLVAPRLRVKLGVNQYNPATLPMCVRKTGHMVDPMTRVPLSEEDIATIQATYRKSERRLVNLRQSIRCEKMLRDMSSEVTEGIYYTRDHLKHHLKRTFDDIMALDNDEDDEDEEDLVDAFTLTSKRLAKVDVFVLQDFLIDCQRRYAAQRVSTETGATSARNRLIEKCINRMHELVTDDIFAHLKTESESDWHFDSDQDSSDDDYFSDNSDASS